MNDSDFIPQMPQMPQFRNYAQEIHDQFALQQAAMAELVALNKELSGLLRCVVQTQRSQEETLGQIARFLEASKPPASVP